MISILGVQAYCVPLISSKPYILPDHSRPIQVVIDPKINSNTWDNDLDNTAESRATHAIQPDSGYCHSHKAQNRSVSASF